MATDATAQTQHTAAMASTGEKAGTPSISSADRAIHEDAGRREEVTVHKFFKGGWRRKATALLPRELKNARNFARYCPLFAAIIAPCSTLMDIPGLTQPWYTIDGQKQKDPKGCTALSAVGVALNVIANVLLVIRFSYKKALWRRFVSLSLVFWLGKLIIALVNVSYYGYRVYHIVGMSYAEAFWCAVVSVIMSGIISFALGFHYVFAFGHPDDEREDLRLTGRKFMLSVTLLTVILGLQALAFNQLEGWNYLDSIYFSVQTALTIGYGDLVATTAAGKVLVFVFSVLTISQLANEVSIIIDFISTRSEQRRKRWRKRTSVAMHREALKLKPYATLIDEMSLIHKINLRQQSLVQGYDLLLSGFFLASFWVVGAAIFHGVEGWGYGNALYGVMVLSLTIGFGDYSPVTPAGRVIWIVYALMAVPVVTNFVTQTVSGILYTWTEHQFTQARFEKERRRDPEVFAPHSHFILRAHETWDDVRHRYMELTGEKKGGALAFNEDQPVHAGGASRPATPASHTSSAVSGRVGRNSKSQRGQQPNGWTGSGTNTAVGTSSYSSPIGYSEKQGDEASAHTIDEIAAAAQLDGHDPDTDSSDAKAMDAEYQEAIHTADEQEQEEAKQGRPRRGSEVTPNDEKVIADLLNSPDTHDAVVETLGCPEITDPEKGPAKGRRPRRGPRARRRPQGDHVAPGGDETEMSDVTSGDESSADADTEGTSGLRGGTDSGAESDSSANFSTNSAPAQPSAGPHLRGVGASWGQDGKKKQPPPVAQTEDRDYAAGRVQFQLLKELVDRVTRLEAQGRQMLIDSMDKDLACTLLLADRNLQIRDAFLLYDQGIDPGAAYRAELERVNKDREEAAHRRAVLLDADESNDQDMLTRVRRYRSTFAEVLVLSSTLLRLDGEDLRRFERWHQTGDNSDCDEARSEDLTYGRGGDVEEPYHRRRLRDHVRRAGHDDRKRRRERLKSNASVTAKDSAKAAANAAANAATGKDSLAADDHGGEDGHKIVDPEKELKKKGPRGRLAAWIEGKREFVHGFHQQAEEDRKEDEKEKAADEARKEKSKDKRSSKDDEKKSSKKSRHGSHHGRHRKSHSRGGHSDEDDDQIRPHSRASHRSKASAPDDQLWHQRLEERGLGDKVTCHAQHVKKDSEEEMNEKPVGAV